MGRAISTPDICFVADLQFSVFWQQFGWQLLKLLFHIGVCLAAFLLLRRWEVASISSFAISLIFAAHPVHAESVAWISGSSDLLFGIFLFGEFWFVEADAETRRRNDLVKTHLLSIDLMISIIFYAFALGSKEIGILCFSLFHLIFAKGRHSDKNSGRATLPLFRVISFGALAAFDLAVRWLVLGAISLPVENGVGFKEMIPTIPAIFVFHIRQMIFPVYLGANRTVTDCGSKTNIPQRRAR